MQRRLTHFIPALFGIALCMFIAAAPVAAVAAEGMTSADVQRAVPAAVKTEIVQTAHHEGTEGATEEKEADIGFPQLNYATFPGQIFWILLSLALMYVLMKGAALPGVDSVIAARKDKVDGALSSASSMQEESAKVTSAYEEEIAKAQDSAKATLKTAQAAIAEKHAQKTAAFVEHAQKRTDAAMQSIARAQEEAASWLVDVSAELATDISAHLAGVQTGKAEAKKAVTAVMKEEA